LKFFVPTVWQRKTAAAWMRVQNVGPNFFSHRITDTRIRDAWRRRLRRDRNPQKVKNIRCSGGRESVRILKNSKTLHTPQLFAFAAAHSKNNISFNPRSANPVEEYVQHKAQSMSVIRSLICTNFYPQEKKRAKDRKKIYYKCVADERKERVKPNIKILSSNALCSMFNFMYVCNKGDDEKEHDVQLTFAAWAKEGHWGLLQLAKRINPRILLAEEELTYDFSFHSTDISMGPRDPRR